MYTKTNNLAVISGNSGKYDSFVQNPNARYGRNAIDSFKNEYIPALRQPIVKFPKLDGLAQASQDEFIKKTDELDSSIKQIDENEKNRAPINFEMQYSIASDVNTAEGKQSLLGAAYEEMDKQTSISTEELTKKLQDTADEITGENLSVEMSAEALDINKDGQIDVGEYATSILVSDSLSNNGEIKGTINQNGLDNSITYANKKNYEIASQQYKALYDLYNLQAESQKFLADSNNLA